MKFIEHSNSVYKSNKKYVSPKKKKVKKIIFELSIFVIILSILLGILSEVIQSNNSLNALKKSHKLGGYGEYKIAYGVSGSGSNIILFEPDIGKTLLEWNGIVRESISGAKMIYYDRFGYGGSEVFKDKTTIETQADILSNLVKNADYKGKQILVSEGYGSLIHLEYLKNNPQDVSAMILINPSIFNHKSESVYGKLFSYLKMNMWKLLSFLNIPKLLDKFSVKINPYISLYREKAVSRNLENYINRMMGRDYYSTVYKETKAEEKYISNFDLSELLYYDIPLIIIDSESNKNLNYKELLGNHFKEIEVIYFEDINDFTYTHDIYLRDLISNINSRIIAQSKN